ncbi:MAG: hypothetical protein U0625_06105 [Phycisphaerales bacterium]
MSARAAMLAMAVMAVGALPAAASASAASGADATGASAATAAADWRATLDARLRALDPARSVEYLVLAEDVLDHAAAGADGESDRALARRLAALAGALDVSRCGASAALLLADSATNEAERARMRSVAAVLGGGGEAAAAAAPRLDAATALLQAFAAYRRGEGARAKEALARAGAAALLDAHPELLSGGAQRFRAECDAMRPGMAPAFTPAQSEALAALAASILAGSPRSWSEATVRTGAAPLPEVDIADPRSLFGVDPAECLWRDGAWQRVQSRG